MNLPPAVGRLRLTRPSFSLVGLGCAMEVIYLLAFVWPFPLLSHYRTDTDMATIMNHNGAGFALFTGSCACLFGLLGIAWWASSSRSASTAEKPPLEADVAAEPRGGGHRLWIVLGFGALFGLTLSFVYPVTAIDIFTYIAQSRIFVHYHQNPIFVTPSRHGTDPIMALAGGWEGFGAPYGPLGILIDAIPTLVAAGNLLLNLILLKLLFSGFAVLEAGIAYRILIAISPATALSGAVVVAWNPLILFETSANGHNDIVMVVLASLGILAVLEFDSALGILLVAASALVKYATLPLLPIVLIYVLTRPGRMTDRIRKALTGCLLSVGLAVLAYAPFWEGPSTLNRSLLENGFHLQSFGSFLAWTVPNLNIDGATNIGRILFVPIYLYALWQASKGPEDLIKGCALAMLGFAGLAVANFKIWYAVWVTGLAATSTSLLRLTGLALAIGATLSAAVYAYVYLWFGETEATFAAINSTAYLMTFLPPALVLAAPVLARIGWTADRRVSQTETGRLSRA